MAPSDECRPSGGPVKPKGDTASSWLAGRAIEGRDAAYALKPAPLAGTTVFDWSLPPFRKIQTSALWSLACWALAAPIAMRFAMNGVPAAAVTVVARRRKSRRET